jgi:hypothetical protein
MKRTVVWVRLAEQELARLWTEAGNKQEITSAANRIDRVLRTDPESVGEPLKDGARLLTIPPLTVDFSVLPLDNMVRVNGVMLSQG